MKARTRIARLKITGSAELTAGQLAGRKSLGSSLWPWPRDRRAYFVNSFVISSVELVPCARARAGITRPTVKFLIKISA